MLIFTFLSLAASISKLFSLFRDHICCLPLLIFKLLIQLKELRAHGLSIRIDAHGLIMHAETALSCSDTSDLVKITLKLHEFCLFGLDNFGKISYLNLRLLLVMLVL